ncbi:MAG: TonB-dependent receptor [Bacteroidota bacterium]
MLRKLYATLTVLLFSAATCFAQGGVLTGKVTDAATGEEIPFANIGVMQNGSQVYSGVSEIDGGYTIKPINAGKYDVKATYVGYQTVEIKGVFIADGKNTYLDIKLQPQAQTLGEIEIITYEEPLIDPDTKSGGTVTREEFQSMPSKNINSVASTTAGVFQGDEGDALNMRGQRSNGTDYYIDGQKVIGGAGLPQSSIEQVSVITGGLPAQYGDATGGIISITTRGPQSQLFGGVELIKSLDAYGYNFVGFSLGGPLVSKTDSTGYKQSVLGYIISGEYVNEKDDDPSAVGTYEVKPEVLADLERNPLRPATIGTGTYLNSEFLTAEDYNNIKYKNNNRNVAWRFNAKLDFKPTANMVLTLGGSVDYNRRHAWIYEYSFLNPSNNPEQISNTWRVYAKITQKFGTDEPSQDQQTTSNIRNAFYTLQVGYANYTFIEQDDTHTDQLFKYGYIGKFNTYKGRTYTYSDNGSEGPGIYQTGFQDTLVTYDPGTNPYWTGDNGIPIPYTEEFENPNPLGAMYTIQYYDLVPGDPFTLAQIQQGGGMLNGDRPSSVYSLWYNTGRQYGGYTKRDNSQFRVFTNFSADVGKNGDHAVMVGFEYEQRTERFFFNSPIGMWSLMRQLANFHLSQLDTANPIYAGQFYIENLGTYDVYNYERKADLASQKWFDRQLREKLGKDPNGNEWIDVDSYGPEMYSLNMFSADDLLNDGNGYVSYYGFDYKGNKLKSNPSFSDFFTKKDENGNYTRDVGAYQPIYVAGYIQDKFDFRDIKFNIGLRVDRFDANQKVLKDKYLLYTAKTAGEVSNLGTHPSNIGNDYVVYVDDFNNPTTIVGYHDPEQDVWYDADGVVAPDPNVIADASSTGTITPYLTNPNDGPGDQSFLDAFEDYKPQITVMPRIAFAFPISDVANFFAHYDVLTQRPQDFARFDPTSYYYITNRQGQVLNNPNLKPERTTDYELGFTQTLTEKKNSAITLSAFYREMRDMIQVVAVNQAYPISYTTFGNIDFGTVKGFSVAYDLRRSGGVRLTASYTLQFADGTGSSATEGINLVSSGLPNLRTTIPLDFDQRHSIVTNVDYRFGTGKDYRGPVWAKGDKNMNLLEGIGFNLVFRAGSGLPYTKQANITQEAAFGIAQRATLKGSVNGSRLPWQYRVDLRVDKNFELAFGKGEGDKKKLANLNVYVQVLNVLNTKNIVNVYKATGNPDDDGYLTDAAAQTAINSQVNPSSFIDLYSIKVNNPNNYSIPRRIRLGVTFDF